MDKAQGGQGLHRDCDRECKNSSIQFVRKSMKVGAQREVRFCKKCVDTELNRKVEAMYVPKAGKMRGTYK